MKINQKTIQFMWRRAWSYPKYVIGLAIFVPLSILFHQFLPPLVVAHVLDRLSRGNYQPNELWGSFGSDLLLYAGLVILGSIILWRVVIILIWKLEGLVVRDIAQIIFAHLMRLSANFHANRFGGSLVSQASKLQGSYIRFADTTVFDVTTLILAFIFTAIILAPRAPQFVIILFAISAVFMITATIVTRRVRQLNAIEANAQNKQTGFLADAVTNVMAVKSFAAGAYEKDRYNQAAEYTRHRTMDIMRASTLRDTYFASITSVVTIIALVMAAAGVVVFQADIATVFLVVTYTANIGSRLWEFCQHTLRNYNRALADSQEMIDILQIKPEVKDPESPEEIRIKDGAIEFKTMSFRHADAQSDDILFENLNLKIHPGEKIGLVGHSGSGKTTLTKLLLRFADIDEGEILIDEQNIAHVSQDDLRRNIAYVPQEPLLFHRSIRENIAYGNPKASEDEIRLAADRAHAAEFIEQLPKKYDTLVGERGVKLSGGQRQRIAIARAMLKDAPIILLDEATSALDSESERLIQDALGKLMKGRTTIVIAHRLSTIQKMDRIIVLEDGTIIEQGSHTDLLKQNGTYAQLWSHQSGGFIED